MSYIRQGSSHGTPINQKWLHIRITQFSKEKLDLSHFRALADSSKPPKYAIPKGSREKFETYQELKWSKKQAQETLPPSIQVGCEKNTVDS